MSASESAPKGRRQVRPWSQRVPLRTRVPRRSRADTKTRSSASRRARRPLAPTTLYQFLGIFGGGAIAGILIAINASVVFGVVFFLACIVGVAATLKGMKNRGLF